MLSHNLCNQSSMRRLRGFQNDMNRLFPSSVPHSAPAEYPLMNVWGNGETAVVTAETPGVDIKDLDISVEGDLLKVSGKRGTNEPDEGESFHRQECSTGAFIRIFQLPYTIDPEKVVACYAKGVLTLTVSRHENEKPKKIEIKTK